MNKKNSLVSVVIPLYNSEKFISQALDSALCQTYRPIEIIIVDDGSTDGSSEVAMSFKTSQVKYFYQSNSGIGDARNQGVKESKGEFIAFLDADDLWMPNKLASQIEAFIRDITLDMVFGHVSQFYDRYNDDLSQTNYRRVYEVHPGYTAGAMLIKRKTFFQVGLFNIELRVGEFIDWYIKAIEKGLKEVLLPDVVLRRRIHTTNIGIREREAQTDYLRILKAKLDRSRQRKSNGS